MEYLCAEFAARLKEERRRLGLTQPAFGALGGVGKLAQMKYENDGRWPSVEYLFALGKNGVDIVYLVTGERQVERVIIPGVLATCIEAVDEVFSGPMADRAACIGLLYSYASHQDSRRLDVKMAARAIVEGWGVGHGGGAASSDPIR